ncbi:Holliday junction resolvase RuvX [Candidatus Dependentiae bacterium]|nr:MAG: Holliday junction resolvase RuvX [Candidatus Dependentiae bacterium]
MYNKKIIALDLGDKWIGVAIADSTGIICRPLTTFLLPQILPELKSIIDEHKVFLIIVGLPKTMSGTSSLQTEKTISMVKKIKQELEDQKLIFVQWKLWDERLSSKRAQKIGKKRPSPEEKKKEHARAAAFILQSYLDNLAFKKEISSNLDQEL